MDVNLVPRKSILGEAEVKSRAHNIVPALRLLLILSDGKKSVLELHQNFLKMRSYKGLAQLQRGLTKLIKDGYLEDTSARINIDGEVHGSTHWSDTDAKIIKQELVAMADYMLGDQGKIIVNKIKSAGNNRESIILAINNCTKLVRLFIDEDKADQLALKSRTIIASRN
ncbi:MAG: hypothetical protein ACI9LU_000563 [Polaribacter sp.]|jgi:hypothetical protein